MRPLASDVSRRKLVILCLLGLGANACLFGPMLLLTGDGQNDFMGMYAGARLAFTGNMYDIHENFNVQHEAAGWENPNLLAVRLPFDALLMWPWNRLPYLQAQHLWEIAIVLTVALFCCLWPYDRKIAALACCWSFPLLTVFANGQDVALLLVVIALALRHMKRGSETAAGLVFSLCAVKFHLFLLVPLLVLSQKRWRFLGGLSVGAAILAVASFTVGGWNWPAQYLNLIRTPGINPAAISMPNLHGLVYRLPHHAIWQAAGTLAVALIVWHACRKTSFEYGIAAAMTGGVLVAPHDYLADCALVLPALLLTLPMAAEKWRRYFYLFLLSPLSSIWGGNYHTWITTLSLLALLIFLGKLNDQHFPNAIGVRFDKFESFADIG